MSMALQVRVAALEAEVRALKETIAGLIDAMTADPEEPAAPAAHPNPNGPRRMCPKCGEKPNYFLHTRSCKGPKQKAPI